MLRVEERCGMSQEDSDVSAVIEANLRFYEAFGSLDIAEMDKVWEASEQVFCIHPGWPLLTGWEQVRKSWERIFYSSTLMHFNITDAQVAARGDCAWVSCVENISSVVDGRATNFAVRATNIFVRGENGWLMVHHHGSG